MAIRKAFFWLHLAEGCVAGAIILVMSFTGVLLTYERQIVAWSDRGNIQLEPPAGAGRMPVSALLAAVAQQREGLVEKATLTLRSDPREPAELRTGRDGAVYVDPYTGKILKGGSPATRTTFQKITAWHRWLGAEGPGRATAKAITGACNIAFLVLILSGAYLWLRGSIVWFRSKLSGKARDFNWHHVFGLWAVVPLFLVVVTAMPMSYSWANDLVYRITGSEPPPSRSGPPRERPDKPSRGEPATNTDALWARAAGHVPEWRSLTARAILRSTEPASFTIDTGDGGQPQKRSTLTIDPATAAVVGTETFADASAGRRLRMWTRFVHTGEYYGVIGQTIAGIASAAAVMLVWTGISLSLRRLAAWNLRRRKHGVSDLTGVSERT